MVFLIIAVSRIRQRRGAGLRRRKTTGPGAAKSGGSVSGGGGVGRRQPAKRSKAEEISAACSALRQNRHGDTAFAFSITLSFPVFLYKQPSFTGPFLPWNVTTETGYFFLLFPSTFPPVRYSMAGKSSIQSAHHYTGIESGADPPRRKTISQEIHRIVFGTTGRSYPPSASGDLARGVPGERQEAPSGGRASN